MKALSKYWKVILALLLAIAALPVFLKARRAAGEYELQRAMLDSQITTLKLETMDGSPYEAVQAQLEPELNKLAQSRQALYSHFPAGYLEEDQIRYVLSLEEQFGTEIHFSFSQAVPLVALSDGAQVGGLTLAVNYETSYQGFKDMVAFLATDSRISSVRYAVLRYDRANDIAAGTVVITLYTLSANPYERPEASATGQEKDTIFD